MSQRSSIAVSYGVSRRHVSDPVLLWLWRRPAAIAPIWPLAWEFSYAAGVALGSKKKKKKKKKVKCLEKHACFKVQGQTWPRSRNAFPSKQEEPEVHHLSWIAALFCDSQFICLDSLPEKQLLTTFHQLEKRRITFWKVNSGAWFGDDEFLTVLRSIFNPKYNFIKRRMF